MANKAPTRKLLPLASIYLLTVSFAAVSPAYANGYKASEIANVLTVASESNAGSYNRDLFKHWTDQDGDGCDTRAEVLIEESTSTALMGSKCKINAGRWISRFDNRSFTNPSQLDIDHFIPLKEAWESGASLWTNNQRQAFANDLEFAGSLIAVSASSNRSKGDKDPAHWQPSHAGFRCTYAVTWIQVKYRWSLSADQAEINSLRTMLSSCSNTATYQLPNQAIEIEGPRGDSRSYEVSPTPTPIQTQTPTPTPTPTETQNLPTVSPGAFCAKDKEGTIGRATNGKVYTCKTSSTDSRLRWRT